MPVAVEGSDRTSEVCSSWASAADMCAPCAGETFDVNASNIALLMASDILYNFTGRRFGGVCSDAVRPCGSTSCWTSNPWKCGCGTVSEVELPGWPVVSVDEVKVDGVALDPSEYRVDNRRLLVALGTRRWPACQRILLADSEDRTFSVSYSYGRPPPVGGKRSAAVLACELLLACSPTDSGLCRLPKRVTQITRQNVSLAVIDPLTLFNDGLTGLADVDLWVASVNRGRARRGSVVVDPMAGPSVRRTG